MISTENFKCLPSNPIKRRLFNFALLSACADVAFRGTIGFSPVGSMADSFLGGPNMLQNSPMFLEQWLRDSVEHNWRLRKKVKPLGEKIAQVQPRTMAELAKLADSERPLFSQDPAIDALRLLSYIGWFSYGGFGDSFSPYIPDSRPGRANDHTVHALTNALSSSVRFLGLERGIFSQDAVYQFINGVAAIKNLIGLDNYQKIKEVVASGKYHPGVEMKVLGHFTPEQTQLFEALFDLGLVFEILTSVVSDDASNKEKLLIEAHSWSLVLGKLNGGKWTKEYVDKILNISVRKDVRVGMGDFGLPYDLLSDMFGVVAGYLLAKKITEWRKAGQVGPAPVLGDVVFPNDDIGRVLLGGKDPIRFFNQGGVFPGYDFGNKVSGVEINESGLIVARSSRIAFRPQ